MIYDVIVVGGGASGLTAAAYLSKFGHSILLLEKAPRCGGLVNSFVRNGFTYDAGIRALDNAGVLFPMLRNLGIEIDFVENHVSLGIEDQVIDIESDEDIRDYEKLLEHFYPKSRAEIKIIIKDIQKIMGYLDIQYGIDNPLFLDFKKDRAYFISDVFPWMFKYAVTAPRIATKNRPVVAYLKNFTKNQALVDIITQHFFTETPAYFALSYFKLYQDYHYPKKGTGEFIDQLTDFINQRGGEIKTSSAVETVNLQSKTVKTINGEQFQYRQLLWAADQKTLYKAVELDSVVDQKIVEAVHEKQRFLESKSGNDSVLTVYISSDLDKGYFEKISAGHFFYTPSRKGQFAAGSAPINGTWQQIKDWLEQFFSLTTFEISIPVLREASLAPPGKSGLIVSVLFDYDLTKYIYDRGWEEQFRDEITKLMILTLDQSIYPELSQSVIETFTSTPVTLQRKTGNLDGAITGWSFTNQPQPAEDRLVRIANAVKTPLPDVHQAGQWTYSPSGFPVALITGKLAADRIDKRLK